ncbi:MAG: hypothetical protein QE485_02240 [Acidovorax sp.]|uniref:hypothetical protein n=1 Tax=Acidovorax sp. TaxID=1872122 RepID=UPI00260C8F24|nr:hypothetical protein [Acidovorax sp.]MDH4416021.1 hypothetical protein [Acidovorax sp.]
MTNTSHNITPIHDELAQAQAAYDSALEKLLKACAEFNEGAGKEYAELMQRHADLRSKIATHEATAEAATVEFKQLLAAANYEKTKAVKDALFKKNDAVAIAEELREALADSERTALPLRASASRAAQSYANAHDMAYAAYARLEVFKALAASEEGLSRAMALLAHVSDAVEVERHVQDAREHRMKFVWNRLVAVAKQLPEAQEQPEVEALGPLQLGPFAGRAYLTPVQAMRLQRAEAEAAAA